MQKTNIKSAWLIRFKQKLLKNWKLKLTALFLALVFWVYVIL